MNRIPYARRRPAPPTPAELHRLWLQLVDSDGPFLAVPALKRVWPQGIPPLDEERAADLAAARPAFDAAWDVWDRRRFSDPDGAAADYRAARDAWVDIVLRDVLGWGDSMIDVGELSEMLARTREGRVLRPSFALRHDDTIGALVMVVDPTEDLRDESPGPGASADRLSPIDELELLLRSPQSTTSLGLVTDGRWWALVNAAPGKATASGVFDSQTFVEEKATRNAFAALLQRRHLVGGDPAQRLPQIFADSELAAEELTVALGNQVRRAVELLVSAFGQAVREASESSPTQGYEPVVPADGDEIYQAVVTVVMRVVFLLFAQEKGLLPEGRLFEQGYGLASTLDELEDRSRDEGEEAMGATHLVWHRLLATSRALYTGASFEDVRIPAYGGSLFDPDRFTFLSAVTATGALHLTVDDRVMLHVLRAVQVARPKGQDARRVSFREIDVEQIGYIYEGLLGYTCRVADTVLIGLLGAKGAEGAEPKVALDLMEDLAESHDSDAAMIDALLDHTKDEQPNSKPASQTALVRALASGDTREDTDRALLAVTRDEGLRRRLRSWIGIIRRDLQDRPFVVVPGDLYIVETPSRRNSGAHYTPKDLAEQVVEHALQPLLYSPGPHQTADESRWTPIGPEDILDLRVADIACGSGAFLVAAARYLAKALVAARNRVGTATGGPKHQEITALRDVVAHCLYGADINAMAVEMCKLSLWLVSLDRDLPFSFVDDKVLLGNSLLGLTDLQQLKALHINPAAAPAEGLFDMSSRGDWAQRLDLDKVVARVARRRRDLATAIDDSDAERSGKNKRRLLTAIDEDLAQLRRVADGVIAAGLRLGGKPGKVLDESYANLRIAVARAYPESGEGDPTMMDEILDQGLTPTVDTDYARWQPLHWVLAVPDVIERGGFDAVVGNPPFLGGKKLTGAMGTNVRGWLVNVIAGGTRGSADLVAYFFLRAFNLLTRSGNLGLIATNTLAQGDSREVGLDRMDASGFTITRAVRSEEWPAQSANLEYAAVWGTRSKGVRGPRVSDGVAVEKISTLLEPSSQIERHPSRLGENVGYSYIGCFVLGAGFVVARDEVDRWIAQDPRNAEVLFPYLNGEDLSSRPDATSTRWVIDFNDREEGAAREYEAPFQHVLRLVFPERRKVNRKALRDRWWQYADKRPSLRKALAGLDHVLAIAQTTKVPMPMRLATGPVFSHMLCVFGISSFGDLSVMSACTHQNWILKYGSTLETRSRYTPSDIFDTFPRPDNTPELDRAGRGLHCERQEIMLRRDLGLTRLYNLVNDPDLPNNLDQDVARMREIHAQLDHTVMAAYGWEDLPLDHGFHTYRKMTRWTVSQAARVEILDRLLEENHRRAALQGVAPPVEGESETEGDDE